jgi:2-polyprenyl-6-methoxyphenol hydroxylase-like FAD-dependent oxidoreductase
VVAKIVILGAGVCGLAAGILLARDGHDVTVLEGDPEPVPDAADQAWATWSRGGVVQFRQPHYLQTRCRHLLDVELPDVRDALLAAGAVLFDTLSLMPPSLAALEARAGDERFVTITARRSTLEQVVARATEAQPRLEVRRGVAGTGLVTRILDGIQHVTGVRTEPDAELRAELVVDAMGRRSPLAGWLRDAGAGPMYEEAEDSGFTYYTRFFRSSDHGQPQPRGRLLTPIGSFSILTLPGDNDTWSVTLFSSSRDQPLKQLRDPDRWTSVVKACPLQAHWLDGQPITGVLPMAGVIDRCRRLVVDGRPVATGVAAVADAWACTNPSLGRGIALGFAHAVCLRDVARTELGDPQGFAAAWDATTEAELTPWYRGTVDLDRARLAEIDALRAGLEPPRPQDPRAVLGAALPLAMVHDAEVFRAFLEIMGCLTLPQEVFARPGMVDRVLKAAGQGDVPPPPGPTRQELLGLLA